MLDRQVRVTFEPHGRAVHVLEGTTVVEAASRAGMTLETPCGGQGTCGKCRVRMLRGACKPHVADRDLFSPRELDAGWRLACQTRLCADSVIEVPAGSLFADGHQILTSSSAGKADEVLPAVRKAYVRLAPPTLGDEAPDLLRIQASLGPLHVDLSLLRELGGALRATGFAGTAVLADHRMIGFESGDTTARIHGAAFDIGTTTIVGSLIDLATGDELAVESEINRQVRFGDDVVSRIRHAAREPDGLAELRGAVAETVEEILDRLCARALVRRDELYEVTFAGNTTMQHLLCGIDPAPLGTVPFVPVHGRGLMLSASELGVRIHPRGTAVVFPVIGGFVGGDTVAGMLATRLPEQPQPALMIDIGTNGEIVLAHEGKLWAASTAAGPAFEGARIACGMRATRGAIEKVVFDADVRVSTIGGTAAVGLCGSALVDAAAELLRAGIVTSEGRMLSPEELPAAMPPALSSRVRLGANGQPEFVLAGGAGGNDVALTQRDLRELQLAAGAIRAGITILLKQAHLRVEDLKLVLIAGGFGSFIRRSNAQRIGLIPPGVDHRRILYVGNTSLAGAKWALISTNARKRAEELARLAHHVELSQDLDFQMEFVEAMIFPEE
jgi:uncharacterized 2Fe-2S/4Fe-4S cluster protein (DUF4445 family)